MSSAGPDVALDVVEFWVDNVEQMTRTFEPFGFAADDRWTPRQPGDDQVALLRSGHVALLVREGGASSPVRRHVARHGDGVGCIRLTCDHPEHVAARARSRGIRIEHDGEWLRVDLLGDGSMLYAIGSQPTSTLSRRAQPGQSSIDAIDHVTYCLAPGTIDAAAAVYQDVLGLADLSVDDVAEVGDEQTGMRSRVLRSASGFTVVLTEPRSASRRGQTYRFLDAHAGPGVQHIAIACDDLAAAVPQLRARGVSFLPVPPEHLDASHARMHDRLLDPDNVRRAGILVDADQNGLLLQLFTRPLTARGTFFIELIQRDGARGFGAGNVRALFAAVEADTARSSPEGSLAMAHPSVPPDSDWRPALVDSARARIPFYRDHLGDTDGRRFRAVPTFDKSSTVKYGRFPFSAGGAAGACRVLATSGTSGHRIYVALDQAEWQRTGRWLESVGRGAEMTDRDVLLNTHCYGLWVGGPALDLLANRCGAGLVPLGPVNPSLVLELLADGIGTAISATPSYMRRLIETAEAERLDLRRTPLRVGFIGAEPAETAFREQLLARLPDGFRWIELYGLTETGGPAVACAPDPDVPELVVNTNEFLVEVLDLQADRPVPLGDVGELTISTRRTDGRTPLVRYRTRDLVRAAAGTVDAVARLSRILGRVDHSLKIGGVLLYPSAVSDIMAEMLPPSAEWRAIIKREREDDELLIEAEASQAVCDAVARTFRERIGVGLVVAPLVSEAFTRSREKTQRLLIASAAVVDTA